MIHLTVRVKYIDQGRQLKVTAKESKGETKTRSSLKIRVLNTENQKRNEELKEFGTSNDTRRGKCF